MTPTGKPPARMARCAACLKWQSPAVDEGVRGGLRLIRQVYCRASQLIQENSAFEAFCCPHQAGRRGPSPPAGGACIRSRPSVHRERSRIGSHGPGVASRVPPWCSILAELRSPALSLGWRTPVPAMAATRCPATAVWTGGRSAHRRREVDIVTVLRPRPLGLRDSKCHAAVTAALPPRTCFRRL